MSREIKFRAWDKKNKEMILHDSFFELQKWNRTQNELKDFILVQFTGLKDKNGKEIYEGDIIINRFVGQSKICLVKYKDASFQIEYQGDIDPILDWVGVAVDTTEDLEVIGNIYENKELLKD